MRVSDSSRPARVARRRARSSVRSPSDQERRPGRRAAGERLHPRDQLLERERLGQVVVGAEVQALDAIADRRRGGQHQDPRVRAAVAQRHADRVAVHARQVAVEHDHVVAVDEALLQRGRPVIGEVGRDPAVAQPLGDVVGELDVILDHQYAHADIVHHPGHNAITDCLRRR